MRPLPLKRSVIQPILDNVLDAVQAYLNIDDGSIMYVTPAARATLKVLIPDTATVEEAAGILADADHLEEWQRWDVLNAAKVRGNDTPYHRIPPDDPERAYEDMWAFIDKVDDGELRKRLITDVQQDHPFKQFEKTLSRTGIDLRQWYKFQQKQRSRRFVLWLAEQGFYPEWDRPLDDHVSF